MKRKFFIITFFVILAVIGVAVALASENALIFHPKGLIAQNILDLILMNLFLMLIIVIPTYILLLILVWKYCMKNDHAPYDPDHSYGPLGQLMMWVLPSIIVAVMAWITWEATHRLNPYKPLESELKPLVVQVVALDWKWLFIYPEQGIATLNALHIPERTPIHFKLTADNTPMNSFWIPQLSGQIYSMTGMTTQLYVIADGIGEYTGRAVEINGEGYAGMTFPAISSSQEDFEGWITKVKQSPLHLTEEKYQELVKPAIDKSISLFSEVENDLFQKIIDKYHYPTTPVL